MRRFLLRVAAGMLAILGLAVFTAPAKAQAWYARAAEQGSGRSTRR